METESQAKIAIRGKGSVKEGKGKSDAAHTSNQDEDLHCLIMADTEEKINKAKKLIAQVIETVSYPPMWTRCRASFVLPANNYQAASIPEGQNELKRNQLRELAALNGTLRDDENQACQNCGEIGHRKYDCPQQRNFTANIICRVCGNAGHMARDCPDRSRGQDWRNTGPPQRPAGRIGGGDSADNEYERLMNEIAGGGGDLQNPARQIGYGGGDGDANGDSGNARAPWQRGPTGAPAPWQQPRDQGQGRQQPSNPAPWARGGNNYNDGYNSAPPPPSGGSHPPWQQNRGGQAPWQNGNGHANGNGGGYGGGYGGGGGGGAPWLQQGQQQQGYDIPPPPPPPPADDVPPPPPPPA